MGGSGDLKTMELSISSKWKLLRLIRKSKKKEIMIPKKKRKKKTRKKRKKTKKRKKRKKRKNLRSYAIKRAIVESYACLFSMYFSQTNNAHTQVCNYCF